LAVAYIRFGHPINGVHFRQGGQWTSSRRFVPGKTYMVTAEGVAVNVSLPPGVRFGVYRPARPLASADPAPIRDRRWH
jgi:hypothetical protein